MPKTYPYDLWSKTINLISYWNISEPDVEIEFKLEHCNCNRKIKIKKRVSNSESNELVVGHKGAKGKPSTIYYIDVQWYLKIILKLNSQYSFCLYRNKIQSYNLQPRCFYARSRSKDCWVLFLWWHQYTEKQEKRYQS